LLTFLNQVHTYEVAPDSDEQGNITMSAKWKAFSAWWKLYGDRIPTWKRIVRRCSLFQTSSAAAERCISLINNMFGKKQFRVLADRMETAVMMRYNQVDGGQGLGFISTHETAEDSGDEEDE